MDGVLGQEGEGPGARGTPRRYGCLAASTDPVALDAMMAQAMGYRSGQILHLAEAGERNLGTADTERLQIIGDRQALDFSRVHLPATHWYFRAPSWISAPVHRSARLRPKIHDSRCAGCGQCAAVCPREAIEPGHPPRFDLDRCVGCMCCAEICPEGAIEARQSIIARLIGAGI